MRGQSGLCDQLHLRRRNAVVLIDNVVTEFNAPPGLIYLTKVANSSSARNVRDTNLAHAGDRTIRRFGLRLESRIH